MLHKPRMFLTNKSITSPDDVLVPAGTLLIETIGYYSMPHLVVFNTDRFYCYLATAIALEFREVEHSELLNMLFD